MYDGDDAAQGDSPYNGYTGTVHQFGFVAARAYVGKPSLFSSGDTQANASNSDNGSNTFKDIGLGCVYDFHYYVSKQFNYEIISSLMLSTASYYSEDTSDELKMTLPVDIRLGVGPSEDFNLCLGSGLQWAMLGHDIHQLAANIFAGISLLGPQRHLIHFNTGTRLHLPIAHSNKHYTSPNTVDMTRDKECVVLAGGVTIDLDKHKTALLMLNYEKPLATPHTQMFSLALLFHIGGSR
ncbi:MAG: hypothetical protein J5486_10975 [Bacteroidaceae bacterium]|nr:hypothetical protein [Bacteroidaceae bacterium]